jgi:ABC-type antimicrobial peptide transport system permease subunit
MALGARRSDVVWLVVRDALLLVAIGVAVGAPAAFLVGRFASSRVAGLIFGLETTDPFVIGTAILILTAVATFAAYLPARRAARVDPMIALRAE